MKKILLSMILFLSMCLPVVAATCSHEYVHNEDEAYIVRKGNCLEPTLYMESCKLCGKQGYRRFEGNDVGHAYQAPIYTWNEEHTSCVGQAICQKDPTHIISENAKVRADLIHKVVDGEAISYYRFMAEFTNPRFKTQKIAIYQPDAMEGVKVEILDYKTIKISWNPPASGCEGYLVRVYKNNNRIRNKYITEPMIIIDGLIPNKAYKIEVKSYNVTPEGDKLMSKAWVQEEFIIPYDEVTQMTMNQMNEQLYELNWEPMPDVDAYGIYRKRGKESVYRRVAIVEKDKYAYELKNLLPGTYQYCIRGLIGDNNTYGTSKNSNVCQIKILPERPVVYVQKVASDKVKISWNEIDHISAYQVFKKTGSGSYQKIATTRAESFESKVTKGKKYYYKVRSYISQYGLATYSPYSKAEGYTAK